MVILSYDPLKLRAIGNRSIRKYSMMPSIITANFKDFDAKGGTHGRAPCGPIVRDMVWDAEAASERERILKGNTPIHPTAREHSSQGRKINSNHLETRND